MLSSLETKSKRQRWDGLYMRREGTVNILDKGCNWTCFSSSMTFRPNHSKRIFLFTKNDLSDRSSFVPSAPCPPTNIRVNSSCTSNNITVSWQASQGSIYYITVAENAQGLQWSCQTISTSCQIPELPCGHHYQVFVLGVDETCYGARSDSKLIRTGKCLSTCHTWLVYGCIETTLLE